MKCNIRRAVRDDTVLLSAHESGCRGCAFHFPAPIARASVTERELAEAERLAEEAADLPMDLAEQTSLGDVLDELYGPLDVAAEYTMGCLEDGARSTSDWVRETTGIGGGSPLGNYLPLDWTEADLEAGANYTPYGDVIWRRDLGNGLLGVDCLR